MEETNEIMNDVNIQENMAMPTIEKENMMEDATLENENVNININENESKNDKFKRLAEYRVNKIMTAVSSLDKLHNRGTYDYTDEQVNIMFSSIEAQLAEVKEHFSKVKSTSEVKFKF